MRLCLLEHERSILAGVHAHMAIIPSCQDVLLETRVDLRSEEALSIQEVDGFVLKHLHSTSVRNYARLNLASSGRPQQAYPLVRWLTLDHPRLWLRTGRRHAPR